MLNRRLQLGEDVVRDMPRRLTALKLGLGWGAVALIGFCPGAVGAAPTASQPIDVAPRLFVPSNYTSEPVLGLATGGGRIAVLSQGGLTLLQENLTPVGELMAYDVDASSVAFDGTDFLLATYAKQPASGGKTYLGALEVQRLAPNGTLKDAAPVLGTVQETGTFDSDVAIACKAPGDCLAAFSMRLYGTGGQSNKDIWVAPVKNGQPGVPIQVTTAAADQIKPTVVWDGSNWVVAWVDLRFATSSTPQYKNMLLYGARVSAAGAVLDPIGVVLADYAELADTSNTSVSTSLPEGIALARSGSTTLLVWRGTSSYDLRGRRLAGNLASLDATPILAAASGASWAMAPQLLPASDGFTAVFGESGSGFGATNVDMIALGFDGKPKGSVVKAGTHFSYGLFAARLSDGSLALGKTVPGPKKNSIGNYYTDTWVERVHATSGNELGATYVSKALTVVNGRALAQSPQLGVVVYADNRNGDNYQYTSIDVHAAVLTATGSVAPSAGIKLSAPAKAVVVAAAGGSRALVVWEDAQTTPRDVIGMLLDGSGNVVKNIVFGGQSYDESWPAVGFDGQNFIVSWTDRGNGYDAGVFRRLAPTGAFVDPAFVLLEPGTTSTTSIDELACAAAGGCLARSGSKYYLLQNGVVAPPKAAWELGLSGFNTPALAGGSSGFALMTKGAGFEDIALIRLAGNLAVLDSAPVPLFDANYVSNLVPKSKAVIHNGKRYVTAWTNGKGVSLASLPESGGASLPYLLDTPGSAAGFYDTAAKNLLLSGHSDKTVVGYQDAGRLVVTQVTAVETTGGSGGSSGSGGTGGSSGSGGTGGVSGSGGAGATGGAAGAGGVAGSGGANTGGAGGGFGGSNTGGGNSGGAAGTGGWNTGGEAGTGVGGVGGWNSAGAAGAGVGGFGAFGGFGTGASFGAAGSSAASGANNQDPGCACRAGSNAPSKSPWKTSALLLGLVGLVARRRKT